LASRTISWVQAGSGKKYLGDVETVSQNQSEKGAELVEKKRRVRAPRTTSKRRARDMGVRGDLPHSQKTWTPESFLKQ